MSDTKFSKEHEWITLDGEVGTIGITKHATEMLGDIVFAELPEKGASVEKDGTAGVVESTKAASDVYTPVSGEVVEINQSIIDDPSSFLASSFDAASTFFSEVLESRGESTRADNSFVREEIRSLAFSTSAL